MNEPIERYISEKEVAVITGISIQTLRNHRCSKIGIPYYKLGRSIKYEINEVYKYIRSKKIEPRN